MSEAINSAAPGEKADRTGESKKLSLGGKYREVFSAAWAARGPLAGPRRLADEAAFLPAALSLQETPAHPAPRRLALAIICLFLIALVWSIFGRIDIVAVAQGRVIVSGQTKVIQPLETSVVRRIAVKDGDSVKAGQVLIELDPTNADADGASVAEQLEASEGEMARTAALLAAIRSRATPRLDDASDTPLAARNRQQLLAEWTDIVAKRAKLDAESASRKAEISTVKESIAKTEAILPMAIARENDFKRLVSEGFISGHATQDRTRERVEMERELAMQRARLGEAVASAVVADRTAAALTAETERALSERNAAASSKVKQLSQETHKAEQRQRLTQLSSPVDGVVQQLAVHTPGGVVTAAQPLMVVVPAASAVMAEVSLANMDIGFVRPGQAAVVKLETFPYTKYGTVGATLKTVAQDAVNDEKKGSYYPAVLSLDRGQIQVDGKMVAISPGMAITAEVTTGSRRIIEYLMNPIKRAGDESLRER